MANRGGPTQLKRSKERARQQKQQEKFARRLGSETAEGPGWPPRYGGGRSRHCGDPSGAAAVAGTVGRGGGDDQWTHRLGSLYWFARQT